MTRHLGAALLLLALASCGGKVPPTRHYTLEIPLSNPARAANSFPVTVAVVRFQAPRPLQQDRVVFRPAPNQVDFYDYHRWADSPPDLVTNNLVRHLKESGMFRSVVTTAGAPADYFLRGTVESLEEVDSGESVSARVALSAELIDARTRQIVWSGRGSHEAPVQERSVEGIVRVLNEGLRHSIEQLSGGLASFFQRGAAAPGGAGVPPNGLS